MSWRPSRRLGVCPSNSMGRVRGAPPRTPWAHGDCGPMLRCSSSTMQPTSFPPRASPRTRKPHVRGLCYYSDTLLARGSDPAADDMRALGQAEAGEAFQHVVVAAAGSAVVVHVDVPDVTLTVSHRGDGDRVQSGEGPARRLGAIDVPGLESLLRSRGPLEEDRRAHLRRGERR